MRIVSPLLKRVVYPCLSVSGVFSRTRAPGLAVLTYHSVLPAGYQPVDRSFDGNLVPPETLRQQLRRLKSNYNLIAPEDALAWLEAGCKLPRRAVLLTCDDGLLNHLTDMLPVLQQEGVKCLFFVTGTSAGEERKTLWYEDLFLLFLRAPEGHFEIARSGVEIGGELVSREQRRSLWWSSVKALSRLDAGERVAFVELVRERLGSDPLFNPTDLVSCRRFGLMNRNELRQLVAAGMTIGAHTMSHPVLSHMSPELARAEITESRARLESAIERRVWAFAYPFGDAQSVTPEVLELAGQAGFAAAFLNFGGGLGTDLPRFALPRIHVTAEMSVAELEAHVSGFHARLHGLV